MTSSRARTKLTPEVQEHVCTLLREGKDLTFAAESIKIHVDTIHGWLQLGKRGVDPYEEFYFAVARARGDAKFEQMDELRKFGHREVDCEQCGAVVKVPGDPKPLMWRMERLYPELQVTQKIEVMLEKKLAEALDAIEGPWGERSLTYGEFIDLISGAVGVAEAEEKASSEVARVAAASDDDRGSAGLLPAQADHEAG